MDSLIQKLAATPHTILITGSTGTGKSHLARKIHEVSSRSSARFVTVNLATLSENLIESELFGHEKGAFSGADSRRIGKLESANGGTVFLDEIGELPPRLQTKLLEALNSHTVSPVGSNREILLNIRIIAATNRDLPRMVAEGKFREDLFFRINAFQIELPTLRSTPERIPELADLFARQAAERQGRSFFALNQDLIQELKSYPWPGNIRELKNSLEFAIAVSTDGHLMPGHLPPYLKSRRQGPQSQVSDSFVFPSDYREAKSHFERSYLREILVRCGGGINRTARESGLSKMTIIEKVRRYAIDVNRIKYEAKAQEKK